MNIYRGLCLIIILFLLTNPQPLAEPYSIINGHITLIIPIWYPLHILFPFRYPLHPLFSLDTSLGTPYYPPLDIEHYTPLKMSRRRNMRGIHIIRLTEKLSQMIPSTHIHPSEWSVNTWSNCFIASLILIHALAIPR